MEEYDCGECGICDNCIDYMIKYEVACMNGCCECCGCDCHDEE